MNRAIGIYSAEHLALGVVEDGRIKGEIRKVAARENGLHLMEGMPVEEIVRQLAGHVAELAGDEEIGAVGVGFPGVIRNNIVEDSPNLEQTKGSDMGTALSGALRERGVKASVSFLNSADAAACGLAARRGDLDKVVRVWRLGTGVGFGHYPLGDGVWEGGHTVVTLDPRERYCSCGGVGHLEGIMGHRAMRLRFLDLEPEEVFEQAGAGDRRCAEFVKLWHQALAAATASSIHMDGPGKFFIIGPNARFVQVGQVELWLHEMVKMSPLKNNTIEVVSATDEIALVGAALNALRSAPGNGER